MKAVILAGGEGTRLRPLTSNQPKPMMPVANRPMMEHIVRLLAEHGFDDIVVTVAFLANQIRNYFGDGSDFGVRMRYATEDSPLGTAGSVRNAAEELDETFLVISGDVLTDIDLSAFVKAHRASRRVGVDRVEAGRGPGRVRHRDHPTTTARSSGSSRSRRGARCSPTRSTPASTCSSPRSSTSSRRARSSTSRATCSRRCSSGASRSTATSPTATGRTSARSRRTSARTRTSSTARSSVEIDGFRLGEDVWLGEGAEVDPDARIDGPAIIGDELPHRGRRARARVHGARHATSS